MEFKRIRYLLIKNSIIQELHLTDIRFLCSHELLSVWCAHHTYWMSLYFIRCGCCIILSYWSLVKCIYVFNIYVLHTSWNWTFTFYILNVCLSLLICTRESITIPGCSKITRHRHMHGNSIIQLCLCRIHNIGLLHVSKRNKF